MVKNINVHISSWKVDFSISILRLFYEPYAKFANNRFNTEPTAQSFWTEVNFRLEPYNLGYSPETDWGTVTIIRGHSAPYIS